MKLVIIKKDWTGIQQNTIQKMLKESELVLSDTVNDCLSLKEPFLLFSSSITDYHFSKEHHFPFLGFGLSVPCPYLVEEINGLNDSYLGLVYARFYHLPFTICKYQNFTLREYCCLEFDVVKAFYELFPQNKSVEVFSEDKSTALEQFSSRMMEYRYKNHGFWGIFNEKEDLIGQIGITSYENGLELSYIIRPDFQRKGITYELCRKVLIYAKNELGITSLDIRVHPSNTASLKLAEKLQKTGIINLQIIPLGIYETKKRK